MKNYENLRRKKADVVFHNILYKKKKNFEEHLWATNNLNKELEKNTIKKFHFYFS